MEPLKNWKSVLDWYKKLHFDQTLQNKWTTHEIINRFQLQTDEMTVRMGLKLENITLALIFSLAFAMYIALMTHIFDIQS